MELHYVTFLKYFSPLSSLPLASILFWGNTVCVALNTLICTQVLI